MRSIGLDIHRDFCAIAISDNGRVRFVGKVETGSEKLEILARSLRPDDQVAMKATSNALEIARILEPHVARVIVATRRIWRRSHERRPRPTGSTRGCSRACWPRVFWPEAGSLTTSRERSVDVSNVERS